TRPMTSFTTSRTSPSSCPVGNLERRRMPRRAAPNEQPSTMKATASELMSAHPPGNAHGTEHPPAAGNVKAAAAPFKSGRQTGSPQHSPPDASRLDAQPRLFTRVKICANVEATRGAVMDREDRRAAIAAYKERKPAWGVYAVICTATGEVWV